MKNMKKLMCFVLCAVMLFSALPVSVALAASNGKCGKNVTWTLDSKGTLTISGKGDMYDYGDEQAPWYGKRESVKSVVIKDGVTSVGGIAFFGCVNLKTIKLPDTLEKIGAMAFECTAYMENTKNWKNGVLYIDNYLLIANDKCPTKYKIKSGTRVIADEAFAYSLIVSATLPDGVVGIGNHAFYCSNIESINIPDGVKFIGERAFEGCYGLNSVTIPKSVKSIGKYAFGYLNVPYNTLKSGFKIYGYKGTAAETYAKKNAFIKFVALKDSVSVKLSKTTLTYNGKVQRPSVTVKNSNGTKLNEGKDYTVKYSSGCKNVGQYTVTVTFKGKYSGTKKLTFKIVPKGTSISKLSSGKKQFTAKWSKQTTQTTGYELQYSTKSSMSGAKTVNVSKNKTTSSTVKKLKSGKKYYVRVRTYKTVKVNGKSVKLYSSWSKVKSVKTK